MAMASMGREDGERWCVMRGRNVYEMGATRAMVDGHGSSGASANVSDVKRDLKER